MSISFVEVLILRRRRRRNGERKRNRKKRKTVKYKREEDRSVWGLGGIKEIFGEVERVCGNGSKERQ